MRSKFSNIYERFDRNENCKPFLGDNLLNYFEICDRESADYVMIDHQAQVTLAFGSSLEARLGEVRV